VRWDSFAQSSRNMAERDVKTMRGFINYDFAAEHDADFLREVGAGVAAGRNRYREDIVDGLQNVPGTFIGLLEERNFGKLVIRVPA
jgi:NADPH-dependent curcumin reductase